MESADHKTWMRILHRVSCPSNTRKAVFHIHFQNDSAQARILKFSNKARKAELLSLQVSDLTGMTINPERRMIIKPLDPAIDEHAILPGKDWHFEFEGEFRDGYLEFVTVAYKIPPGGRFVSRFVYQGVESNSVVVDAPSEEVNPNREVG